MELNFEALETQKWNIPTDRVDKKIGVICLAIMVTPGNIAIKMSKMSHLLYFVLMTAKIQPQFGKNI